MGSNCQCREQSGWVRGGCRGKSKRGAIKGKVLCLRARDHDLSLTRAELEVRMSST